MIRKGQGEAKIMVKKRGMLPRSVIGVFLLLLMIISTVTTAEPAAAADAGISKVSFDGYLKGVEKKVYTIDKNGSTLFYNKDGSTYVKQVTGREPSKRRHMILTNVSSGEKREGYCIEFNADFRVQTEYRGSEYLADKAYFSHMPEDVKKLILAVTYYGRNGENDLPVSGVNSEDYYYATQVMIWEVQQQLRVFERDSSGRITGTKRVAAHGMQADYFYRSLKGRAAEKCYNFLAENISNHFVTPDFVGETAEKAEPVLLKYNMETKKWQATADEGSCDFEMKWNAEDIRYSKSGTIHAFAASETIDGEKIVKVKRMTQEGSSAENLLIWNHEGSKHMQVVSTGSAAPPEFFMRFKTDVPAEVTIEKKDAETGKTIPAEGIQYKIKSVDLDRYISDDMKQKDGGIYETNRDGKATIPVKLQQGTYQLEEIKAPKGYVAAKDPQQFQVDGKTAVMTIEQKDMAQKGRITIKKIGEYKYNDNWADIREKAMGGIDFDIIALADIITPDGTVRAEKGQVVDTIRTDFNGNVSSKTLYLGPYNVVEKDAPEEYRIAEPINVALVYGDQTVEVVEKQINILNRLKRNTDSLGETPKTGDDGGVNTIILVMILSLTMMAVTAVLFRLRKKEHKL